MTKRVQHQHKDSEEELQNLLEENEIVKIKEAFDREDGRRMNSEQLKDVLARIAKVEYEDEKFNIIFMRMNAQW